MAGKRKAKLTVPDIAQDAAERKRVLNILAQRRYRQRRKDRLHALESQVKSPEGHARGSTHESSLTSSVSIDALQSCDQDFANESVQDSGFRFLENHNHNEECSLSQSSSSDPFLQLVSTSTAQPDTDLPIATDDAFWAPFAFVPNIDMQLPVDDARVQNPLNTSLSDGLDLSTALQTTEISAFSFPDDRTLEVPSLTLLNAATKVAHRLNLAHLIWDLTAVSPFYRPRDSSKSVPSLPSVGSSSSTISPLEGLSTTNTPSSVSDSNPIPIPETEIETDLTTLPPHLHPTPTQHLIPHHPLLDLLPWPGTRDKLIQVFNLPAHLRPKNAQDSMALIRLVYDMEDIGGEGIRVQTGDPFEAAGWEFGQVVFERWWWAFEGGLVERSNRGRRGRGERVLSLG